MITDPHMILLHHPHFNLNGQTVKYKRNNTLNL